MSDFNATSVKRLFDVHHEQRSLKNIHMGQIRNYHAEWEISRNITIVHILRNSAVELAGIMRVEPSDLLSHNRAKERQANSLCLAIRGHQPERHLAVGGENDDDGDD